MMQVSPFFEVQAPGGGFAQAEADLEHAFGKAAAWAAGPVKLERAGSHLVIKVIMAGTHPCSGLHCFIVMLVRNIGWKAVQSEE